jgi:cell division protein FtsZ
MAIMTGVQSAQVLGPSTQKQADKSRQKIEEVESGGASGGGASTATSQWGETDGGEPEVEQNNGLDVIR